MHCRLWICIQIVLWFWVLSHGYESTWWGFFRSGYNFLCEIFSTLFPRLFSSMQLVCYDVWINTYELLYFCIQLLSQLTQAKDQGNDEVDFEFLGNKEGNLYILQTNVFVNGQGNREQRIRLWFDPTSNSHSYRILWNSYQIA